MTRWMTGGLLAVALAAVVGVIGCSEWDSSGDGSAWDDSYNWLDFSGVYADAGQGVLVKNASVAFDLTSRLIINESVGTADGTATSFSGVFNNDGVVPGSVLISAGPISFIDDGSGGLSSPDSWGGVVTESGGTGDGGTSYSGVTANNPIVAGSMTIVAGGTTFSDDGSGTLVSSLLVGTGTVAYDTGAWAINGLIVADGEPITVTYKFSTSGMVGSIVYATGGYLINLQGLAISSGTTISATYRYVQSNSATDQAGNSGNPIYTITVLQTGDRLRIIDSNGNVYDGQLYDVNSTAGNLVEIPTVDTDSDTASVQGEIVASFIAEGSAYGQWVTLDGTIVGNMLGTTPNTMFDRHLNGTWRESGGKVGVFFGSAASDAVPLPLPTTDDDDDETP